MLSRLKNVDKKLAHNILDEIIDSGPPVHFCDIGECQGFWALITSQEQNIVKLNKTKIN